MANLIEITKKKKEKESLKCQGHAKEPAKRPNIYNGKYGNGLKFEHLSNYRKLSVNLENCFQQGQ